MTRSFILALFLDLALALPILSAADLELYATDFSGFTVGEDQLAGFKGWSGTNLGEGVHGIDEGFIEGLGKTAYLGSAIPTEGTEFVTVDHSLGDGATSEGKFKFQVVFGITESTEGSKDVFGFDFLNDQNELLAAILFDTSLVDHGIWTDDGIDSVQTEHRFVGGLLNFLTVTIDLDANLWSADLEGTPLFIDIPFTASASSRTFASVGVEWQIADVADPGDNWILFDNITLTALESDPEPTPVPDESFQISRIHVAPGGGMAIEWPTTPGVTYQIEYSSAGMIWHRDLPDSDVVGTDTETTTYTDSLTNTDTTRLYRVVWLEPTS